MFQMLNPAAGAEYLKNELPSHSQILEPIFQMLTPQPGLSARLNFPDAQPIF
jgi:hypothetical protein